MNYINISSEELKKMLLMSNVIMIDVREKKEWDQERIEGSILLPLKDISLDKLYDICEDHLDTTQTVKIVFYCRSGIRSVNAILNLFDPSVFDINDLPFDIELYNLTHGILEYNN